MDRRLRRYRRKSPHVRRRPGSLKFPAACPQRDRVQSSFPCSRVPWQTLPDCSSLACAFALFSPCDESQWLRCSQCTLLFAPAGRRNTFPRAEGANKRISVLVSEKVGSFIQLEIRIIEIVASELMTGFVEHALEAAPFFLQAPLESPGTDV